MAKFNRHDFILKGLLDAVGKQSDYWVIMNADSYYEKGILNDEDMERIEEAIEAQYKPVVSETTESTRRTTPDNPFVWDEDIQLLDNEYYLKDGKVYICLDGKLVEW